MIIYNNSKLKFLEDVSNNNIEDILRENFLEILGKNIGRSEYISWQNSLREMYFIINSSSISNDSTISIEFNIPGSSKRIDFVVAGKNIEKKETMVIIELKQWEKIEITDKDAIVKTRFQNGFVDTSHPSYQAWSYAMYLNGFNTTIYNEHINLKPCAYLHNYKSDGLIDNVFYKTYIDLAPIFLKNNKKELSDYISDNIIYGDSDDLMHRVNNSELRPSKALADSMASMIKGNKEFIMIDDQKVVYENAVDYAKKSLPDSKHVIIVEGGPGTGKSVVAVNLLVSLNKMGINSRYVTKNAAPRAVYESKLTGVLKKTEISNLFTGSGSFFNSEKNIYDALIVDEAHRLNEKSGMFANLGENQIKEIINSSKFSIFFIDDDQKVTFKDIGHKDEIVKWAEKEGCEIHNMDLSSQFRCNGSDGYLSWLDNILQIRETANVYLDKKDYDFRVLSSPNEVKDLIFEKNKINNKARIVAGYCWDWVSRKNSHENDIVIPEYDFGMKWNLASDGTLWIISPESVNEVGCIHTCQGLEVDYIGVIVGDDLIVRNGEILVDPSKRAKTDASLKGYKKLMLTEPEEVKKRIKAIIKNTYRTLMTRGMKGCYVYFTDKETGEFFNSFIK